MKGVYNMRLTFGNARCLLFCGIPFYLLFVAPGFSEIALGSQAANESDLNLGAIPFKIIYETYRETDDKENWELFLINADGSNATNLTTTPDLDEMYPQASPDGRKVCFIVNEGKDRSKVRNVYYMNIDGTGRVKVADNARQACWSPDSRIIAYTKGEFERYTTRDYATRGLFLYNIETGEHRVHPNKTLSHLFNICWPPDGKWFIATVHGGMGYDHTNLAIEATGTKVFDLGFKGCRPDVTWDGKKIVWCPDDWVLWVADLDLTLSLPRIANKHLVFAKSGPGICQQHADWSPHGEFIAFSRGPKAGGAGRYPVAPGNQAKGWDICVGTMNGKWVQITTDGKHNKEPDWVPITTKH
jgi:Tol biopolymer transport system component